MNLIQISHPHHGRRIAVVKDHKLALIKPDHPTCYGLFSKIISDGLSPEKFIPELLTGDGIDYDQVYRGESPWRMLPAFDHPESPLFCMLSGTGLTHKASAENRERMHQVVKTDRVTDSMKMYLWGEEGGKPEEGAIGIQPEWFYKGNGTNLMACNDALHVPPYAKDGGEEPEIAGIYMISDDGIPCRIGFTQANEFSDHVMEKQNYLYLAPSKLRECAIGPELVLDQEFRDLSGKVSINRAGKEIWSKNIKSGESNMCHSLANLEHHHFKYQQHRIRGMVHIHFFGADSFSFGDGITLADGDIMGVGFEGFGRELSNPVSVSRKADTLVKVIKTYSGRKN